jgi:rhodanese-related sulfurtransferase
MLAPIGDAMETSELQSITSSELRRKIAAGEPIVLVDVRTAQEHNDFNIGGVLIPITELHNRTAELNHDDEIIVYCHSGMRSASAAEILSSLNFKCVRSLAGGLKSWDYSI